MAQHVASGQFLGDRNNVGRNEEFMYFCCVVFHCHASEGRVYATYARNRMVYYILCNHVVLQFVGSYIYCRLVVCFSSVRKR